MLRIPKQRFDSAEQLAFAHVLTYNPFHSLPEHRPLGNVSRARRRIYYELSRLRQKMNNVEHYEPTGDETFRAKRLFGRPRCSRPDCAFQYTHDLRLHTGDVGLFFVAVTTSCAARVELTFAGVVDRVREIVCWGVEPRSRGRLVNGRQTGVGG